MNSIVSTPASAGMTVLQAYPQAESSAADNIPACKKTMLLGQCSAHGQVDFDFASGYFDKPCADGLHGALFGKTAANPSLKKWVRSV